MSLGILQSQDFNPYSFIILKCEAIYLNKLKSIQNPGNLLDLARNCVNDENMNGQSKDSDKDSDN